MSKTFDEDCPICDAIAEAGRLIGANATDEQIKTLEDAKASTVYLLNVLEVDDSGKHDGQPKALQVGKLTLSSILDMMDDWGEAILWIIKLLPSTVKVQVLIRNTTYYRVPKGSR